MTHPPIHRSLFYEAKNFRSNRTEKVDVEGKEKRKEKKNLFKPASERFPTYSAEKRRQSRFLSDQLSEKPELDWRKLLSNSGSKKLISVT